MSRRTNDRERDRPDPNDAPDGDAEPVLSPAELGRQLNVLVSARLHAALKAGAEARGCSQAEVVRQALTTLLRDALPKNMPHSTFSDSGAGSEPAAGENMQHSTFSPGSSESAGAPPSAVAKLDAQAYQQLVRVGGNLNQALRAINSGRGEPGDWPTIVEAARAVIALKRHVAGLPPATEADEAAVITLRREAVSGAGAATPARPTAPPRDDGFSTVL